MVLKAPSSYRYSVTLGQPRETKGRVYFSPKEVKHLAVAGLLVMAIGLSSLLYSNLLNIDWMYGLWVFGLFAVVLTASFLSHEIAHKVTAQRRGLWAEFRLTTWGAILTLISVISPLFKIISPGAVMISGNTSGKEMIRISLAGPATNMLLSLILLGTALLSRLYLPQFYVVLMLAAFLNGFMAVFNLVPVGILDGFKIFSWDKKVWGLAFFASAALTIVTYVFVEGLV